MSHTMQSAPIKTPPMLPPFSIKHSCCNHALPMPMPAQGPLQQLHVERISWGAAAALVVVDAAAPGGSASSAGSAGNAAAGNDAAATAAAADARASRAPPGEDTRRPWLPMSVSGVRLVLRPKQGSRAGQSRAKRRPTRATAPAAAWPAVSTALALARRLLPGLPVQLLDVVLEMQVLPFAWVGLRGVRGVRGVGLDVLSSRRWQRTHL